MKKIIRKILKNPILMFVLGLIIAGSIGVYAVTTIENASGVLYDNTTSGINATNVQNAIDDLYSRSVVLRNLCKLQPGYTANTIGAKYECVVGKENNQDIKLKFYILKLNNDNTVKLIAEHNITEGSNQTTMNWSTAMQYIKNNNLKSKWSNVLDVDLPMAQEIADAVGNTSWIASDKDYTDWFCYGTGYGKTCGSNSGALRDDPQALKYKFLFNYTRECANSGCDAQASLGATEAYGYWTRDLVAQNSDTNNPHRAWYSTREGILNADPISNAFYYGVRPVITVLKSNLYQ